MQGTDDLEEVLSERLQELPPPLSRGPSGSGHAARQQFAEDFSFPEDMDTSAEQAKVRQPLQQSASCLGVGEAAAGSTCMDTACRPPWCAHLHSGLPVGQASCRLSRSAS